MTGIDYRAGGRANEKMLNYKNEATAYVALWFSNETVKSAMAYEAAEEAKSQEFPRSWLADWLEENIVSQNPLGDDSGYDGAYIYSELIKAAFNAVNWLEVADDFLNP